MADQFKKTTMKDFEMTYFDLIKYFLGIQVKQA